MARSAQHEAAATRSGDAESRRVSGAALRGDAAAHRNEENEERSAPLRSDVAAVLDEATRGVAEAEAEAASAVLPHPTGPVAGGRHGWTLHENEAAAVKFVEAAERCGLEVEDAMHRADMVAKFALFPAGRLLQSVKDMGDFRTVGDSKWKRLHRQMEKSQPGEDFDSVGLRDMRPRWYVVYPSLPTVSFVEFDRDKASEAQRNGCLMQGPDCEGPKLNDDGIWIEAMIDGEQRVCDIRTFSEWKEICG
tara:strand:+ start:171 stop:917 length:747 start_codon:yes stop_codon:yes gene_type:complete